MSKIICIPTALGIDKKGLPVIVGKLKTTFAQKLVGKRMDVDVIDFVPKIREAQLSPVRAYCEMEVDDQTKDKQQAQASVRLNQRA